MNIKDIEKVVQDYCDKFHPTLKVPTVIFNTRLRTTAGRAWGGQKNLIEINASLYEKVGLKGMLQTIVHEFAHIVCFQKYPNVRVGHGRAWKQEMSIMGASVSRTHSLFEKHDVACPKTGQRRWAYRCNCYTHSIFTVTHNRILAGDTRTCTRCNESLSFLGNEIK